MDKVLKTMITSTKAIHKGVIDVRTQKLYHYTSPEGLLGIFNEQTPKLFFSQYDSLNDTKERKDIFEILHKLCFKLLESNKVSKELYDTILSIQTSDVFGILRKNNKKPISENCISCNENMIFSREECYTYICSFSGNNDSLPMWRMYSKSNHYEGYCIEISTSAFKQEINCGKGFSIDIFKVIYDEEEKFRLIKNVLLPIAKVYDSCSNKEKENFIYIIEHMIYEFQFIFKNKAFAYEDEIRAVLHMPKNEKSCENIISERKYRQSNGLIVPYVVCSLNPLNIKSITIAPTIKEEIAKNNLKDYLDSKKLSHVKIISSDIPIRTI